MSIILSGLITVFQPLLSSLSGALSCEGLGPWYFLLGLRIVAIFFGNGPWDTVEEDVTCNWIHPMHDWSRDFCTAMCHNQHFPISVQATWGMVFTVLLLLIGLMKLSSPPKKKDDHDDSDKDKDKLAVVALAPHRSSADISTIYMVGPHGLTRNPNRSTRSNRSSRSDSTYPAPWYDRYGRHVAYGPGESNPVIEYGPREVGRYGRYGMPVYSNPIGEYGPSEIGGYGGYGMPVYSSPVGEYGPSEVRGYGGYGMPVYSSPVGEYGPSEVGGYGGYGMPVTSRPAGETRMPDHGYNMAHSKTRACPMDNQQTKSTMSCPGSDQYKMSNLHHQMRQPNVAPPYDETARYIPTSCAPLPDNNSSYKGCTPPQCWPSAEHNETIQQRYTDPEECGIRKSPDSSGTASMYSMCTTSRYTGQSEMVPKFCKGSRYSMATKCQPGVKRNMDSIAVPPWEDDKTNMAIKRRPVNRNKMPTKRHVTFDAAGSGEMSFGSNMYSQPYLAENSPMPGNGACAETDPCCMDTRCSPQCEPGGGGEATPSSDNTSPQVSTPGPQNEAKMTIRRICGIPLFDLWVGLILATEIFFFLAIILLQMPSLFGRTFNCTSGATSCPPTAQCAVRGRAEKRVALWALAFTSILFLIGCSAYFNLRMCLSNRFRRMCAKKEEREEACATDTEPEGRVCRGDVEGGNGEVGRGA